MSPSSSSPEKDALPPPPTQGGREEKGAFQQDLTPRPLNFLLSQPHNLAKLGLGGRVVTWLFRGFTFLYDWTSLLVYLLLQSPTPWSLLAAHAKPKARLIGKGEGIRTWRCDRPPMRIQGEMETLAIATLDQLFGFAIQKNGEKRCLGTREMLSEEDEMQPNGKVFKKVVQGRYLWKTYSEVDRMAAAFARGLHSLGLRPRERICIFAETRAEWLLAAIAAFKNSYTVVTLYATLGEDAIIHGLSETEVEFVITSQELLPKFKGILDQTPKVKRLIYMEHPLVAPDLKGYKQGVQILPFCEVIEEGRTVAVEFESPKPDDIAIIMYTSGSTGVPKGVLQSHKNVVSGLFGLTDGLGPVYANDIYIGYLPLAHVLELMCESICFLSGIPIGYSSPLTITDKSSKIKAGSQGDAPVLQPTIMVSVPFALDRIYKGIQEQVAEGSAMKKALFYFFYDYKLRWYYSGWQTPITDALIFKKARAIVGGKVRIVITGGAPLSPDTHEFVRNCLGCTVVQGYGLTETCASATCSTPDDLSVARIGPPLRCCDLRLANWEEGNYTVEDKPVPRGELHIGGDNVAVGYFKLDEATAQDFYTDKEGRRWFRTGDIAVADKDGVFRIIDRKKDLVKLQMGEYLSLGKVESLLKTSTLIDNICIVADPSKNFCVAIAVPLPNKMEAITSRFSKSGLTLAEMCRDPEIIAQFLKELQAHSISCKLARFEIPQAITLCPDLWTPETNLVTAALKLRRKNIEERFKGDIQRMYQQSRDDST